MSQFHTCQLGRINLHIYEMKNVQTVHSSFHIVQPINRRLLAHNSFIPYMLSSTNRLYPSQYELHKKLYDLYGSIVSPRITTLANLHVMSVLAITPDLSFMNVQDNTIDTMNELLLRLIFDPNAQDNKFDAASMKNVKSMLKNELEAQQSSISRHAFEQCIGSAVHDSAGVSIFGNPYELEQLDNEILYKRYIRLLKTSDLHMYVAGNVQVEAVKRHIERMLSELVIPDRHPGTNEFAQRQTTVKQESQALAESAVSTESAALAESEALTDSAALADNAASAESKALAESSALKVVKEIKPVHQDMITAAIRFDGKGKAAPLMLDLFDWIFSGSFHSRMYARLREEKGLAYHIKGWADAYTGVYVVQLGIDGKDMSLALTTINSELEELKANGPSEQELVDARQGLVNRFIKNSSNPREIVDMHLQHLYLDPLGAPNQYIQQLMEIDAAALKQFISSLRLDTIHYLGREDVEFSEHFA